MVCYIALHQKDVDVVGIVFVGVVIIVIAAGVVVIGGGGSIIAEHAGVVFVKQVVDEHINIYADNDGVTVI